MFVALAGIECRSRCHKQNLCRALVVAQMVERLLPTPEIRRSNPDIGNFYLLSTEKETVLKRRK